MKSISRKFREIDFTKKLKKGYQKFDRKRVTLLTRTILREESGVGPTVGLNRWSLLQTTSAAKVLRDDNNIMDM